MLAPVAVAGTGRTVDHVFACYSKGQTDPGVWESSNTAVFTTDDYGKGYWRPWAVEDEVSSTKIGDYYLTCTLPSGMAGLGTYLTDGADVLGANAANADGRLIVGLYPIAVRAGSGPTLVAQFGFDVSGSGACGPPAKDFTVVLTQNGQPVKSLQPGSYWLTVTDHCANHNFELRSCPGSVGACDPSSRGAYRLFCDAMTATGVSHEIAFDMYTDFTVRKDSRPQLTD